MNHDLFKKIKALNALADGSLSMLSLGNHKWMVSAYNTNTLMKNKSFYGKTLDEALTNALKGATNG